MSGVLILLHGSLVGDSMKIQHGMIIVSNNFLYTFNLHKYDLICNKICSYFLGKYRGVKEGQRHQKYRRQNKVQKKFLNLL